jgi:hypothetical protein
LTRILISYRRDDIPVAAGWIAQRLKEQFGASNVFIDIDNIPIGRDFREHLQKVLGEIDVFIAVVGPRWMGPVADNNRISDPEDWVRQEVAAALARKEIAVIPLLVDGAPMPKPADLPTDIQEFSFRNAAHFNTREFESQALRLINSIERLAAPSGAGQKDQRSPGRSFVFGLFAVTIAAAGLFFVTNPFSIPDSPSKPAPQAPPSNPNAKQPVPQPVAMDPWNDPPGSAKELPLPNWCEPQTLWAKTEAGWRLVGGFGVETIKGGSLISFIYFDDKVPAGLIGHIVKDEPKANLYNPDQVLRESALWNLDRWPNGEKFDRSKCFDRSKTGTLYGYRYNAVLSTTPGPKLFWYKTDQRPNYWSTAGGFTVVK